MADDSDLEKNELPTESKLKKAKDKGQIPRSRELSSMVILLVGIGVFWFTGANIGVNLTSLMQHAMAFSHQYIGDEKKMLVEFVVLLRMGFSAISPVIGALVIAAFVAPPFVGGLLFCAQSLKPNVSKLNPIAGFKRIFSLKIFTELLKSTLKVAVIAVIVGWLLCLYWAEILSLPKMDSHNGFAYAAQLLVDCGLLIVLSLTPIVGFDIFYQIWSNLKKLRMSKQEIKDEFKEQEGDPKIKSRIRQMQQSIARRRMMDDIPKADVIVTNPTHYAIALQYHEKTMHAPKVLAKGAGHIAEKIKQIGDGHNIPQLEVPPLARALYRHADIGQTIPMELYTAVAQVLAWVYQLKHWHRQGGTPPVKPQNLSVPESMDFGQNKGDKLSNE